METIVVFYITGKGFAKAAFITDKLPYGDNNFLLTNHFATKKLTVAGAYLLVSSVF